MIEVKAGIMLQQAVIHARQDGQANRTLREVNQYRTGLGCSEQEFDRRNRQRGVLYELLVDGRPVSYGWVARGGAQVGVLHDLHMTVPEHAFYIWDCVTPPQFRGRGYFQSLLKEMLAASDSGVTLALVAVDTKNTASRKALANAGFLPLFNYLSIRVLGRVVLAVANRGRHLSRAQPIFDGLG